MPPFSLASPLLPLPPCHVLFLALGRYTPQDEKRKMKSERDLQVSFPADLFFSLWKVWKIINIDEIYMTF